MTATLPRGTADMAVRRAFPQEPLASRYLDDPDGWATERLRVESWSKPRLIRESVRDHRHTAVPAAHDCAKSHTAASLACWWIDSHPAGEAMVVSTAPVHYQVQSILWAEIQKMHFAAGLPGRLVGLSGTSVPEWYIDGRRVAFGRTPDRMESFQGIHARYVLVIIDEAGGVPDWLFNAADALATNANSRVVAIGNPDDPASHFAEICAAGSKFNVIPISAYDTPRYTGETVSQRLLELLVSDEYVTEMLALGEDSHLYQSKVLGVFPDISSDAVFPPRILKRAIANELPGVHRGGYGADIGRFGDDETCVYRNRGGVIRFVAGAFKQDTEDTADLIGAILSKHGEDHIPAFVDAVGVGAGVYDKLRRRGLAAIDFNGGERAYEPDRYINRRAEVFWTLRQAMDDGLIDLDADDKKLLDQLGRLKWKPVSGGRVQIESKEDMRKRGVKSPDRADAAAMAYACPPMFDLAAALQVQREAPSTSLAGDILEVEW